MSENKTIPNDNSVEKFLSDLDEQQLNDSQVLIDMMQKISGKSPVMWGPSIIGFDKIRYKYASGREGDWMRLGFSPRKGKMSLYITGNAEKYKKQLDLVGKHDIGRGCIYIKKLADVDVDKLRDLIKTAYDNNDMC